jgi:ATP-dependent DNA helicase RecG
VLVPGLHVALFGKIEIDSYTGQLSIMHPEFEILTDQEDTESSLHTGRIVPIYEAAAKITTRIFRTIVHRVLESIEPIAETLPDDIRLPLKLPIAGRLSGLFTFPIKHRTCAC